MRSAFTGIIITVLATSVWATPTLTASEEEHQRELAIYAHRALFPKSLLHMHETAGAHFGVNAYTPRPEVQTTIDQCVSAVQGSIQDELSDCAAIMGASTTYTEGAAVTPAAVTSSLNTLCSSSCYKPYLNGRSCRSAALHLLFVIRDTHPFVLCVVVWWCW